MKLKNSILAGCTALVVATSCTQRAVEKQTWVEKAIENAHAQIGLEIDTIESSGRFLNPVTLNNKGGVYYCGYADWRSGFFPGSVWYLYELTGDTALLPLAQKYTEAISEAQNLTWHHDIGFIINCSFGNGLRLIDKPGYKEVMIRAAKSLCTRFREKPQVIQSWDVKGNSWQSERGCECPVIIDGSCYHVIDYSIEDGTVRHRQTAQGYSDESVWSRGQAWAIYGYTVCYRETKNRTYLDQAIKTFEFMKNLKNMPEDLVPYWDMDAPDVPAAPRDASSASVIASALYEMSTYDLPDAASYRAYADKIMESLASESYTAKLGENGRFILMHSVGSIPHNSEVDVPLNYADYYYLEALKRKTDIEKTAI